MDNYEIMKKWMTKIIVENNDIDAWNKMLNEARDEGYKQGSSDEQAKIRDLINAENGRVVYTNGDGEQVASFDCQFCENMDARREALKGKSDEEKWMFDSECDEHFKDSDCNCYICNGYSRGILINKAVLKKKILGE